MHDTIYDFEKEARARWRDFDDASRKDPEMYERFRRNNPETAKKYFKFWVEQNDRIMSGKSKISPEKLREIENSKKQKVIEKIKAKLDAGVENFPKNKLSKTTSKMLLGAGIGAAAIGGAAIGGKKLYDRRKSKTEGQTEDGVNKNMRDFNEFTDFNKTAYTMEGNKIYLDPGEYKVLPLDAKDKIKDFVKGPLKKGATATARTVGVAAGAVAPVAAIAGTAIAVDKLRQKIIDKKRQEYYARKAGEQAEKAAAYYDEAQLAKEAAIDDYNEACAYEEAALTILDELGYLD